MNNTDETLINLLIRILDAATAWTEYSYVTTTVTEFVNKLLICAT